MPGANPHRAACPVCGQPFAVDEPSGPAGNSCAECDWPLWTPRRPGPVTAELRADFDRRLDTARRRFDSRAAALITASPERFASLIRGGRPAAGEWATARRQAAKLSAGAADEKSVRETVAGMLRGLTGGKRSDIIEIGPEGIGLVRATADKSGSPRLDRDQPVTPWAELLPMLSRDPEKRLLQLAGGIAGLDRAELNTRLADGVLSVIAVSRAEGDHPADTLVICQPAGWPLLEDAARRARQSLEAARLVRVEGMPSSGNGLIDSVAAGMPSLRGYGVVVATVDQQTGAVRTVIQPLFRPGDLPGTEASVAFRRIPGDRSPVTLSVAVNGHADSDDSEAARPTVISTHMLPQPDEPHYQVRAVLDAPGRIRFTEPRGITADTGGQADPLAALPGNVGVRPGAVDLVCAIELAGTKRQVDRRRDMVRELLEQLMHEYPDTGPASLRAGLLGCTDHVFAPGEEKRRVVRRAQLTSPALALAALTRFRGEEIRHPGAAPIEDMLYEAHRMLAGSRDAGRAPRLLLIAGRRPHPHRLGPDKVQPCPFRCDWRRMVRTLAQAGVETVAIADVMPTRAARAAFWADAGQAGLHALPDTSARMAGEDLGVFVRSDQRIGVPLISADGSNEI